MPCERAKVASHLKECERCREIMIDAARLSGLWVSGPEAFAPPPPENESPRAARAWWAWGALGGWNGGRGFAAMTGWNSRWRVAATTAVATAAVTLIAATYFLSFGPSRDGGVAQEVTRPLQGALEMASSIGLTVIPGGETGLAGRTSRYRSGTGETHGVLNQSIDKLEQSRENDPTNRDVSYWLAAAYVATGQTDLARDFTREARERFTHDADIATLYALVLHRDGDLAGAEGELRRALGLEPDNAVAALNLGIVLLEADRDGEANTLLTRVADRHADEPIGERARSILAAHAHD